MSDQKLHIGIVDKDQQKAGKLKKFLDNQMGDRIEVSLRIRGKSCQRMKHQGVNIVVMDPAGSTFRIRNRILDQQMEQGGEHDLESGLIVMASPDEVDIEVDARTIASEATGLAEAGAGAVRRSIFRPVGEWMKREGVMEYLVLFLVYFVTISSLIMAALSFAI
jgi:hypothetical protein